LTHLEGSGQAKFGDVIRWMLLMPDDASLTGFGGLLGMSMILLLILQDIAAEELDDEVAKENSKSYVKS
jgi:hypothetical protein